MATCVATMTRRGYVRDLPTMLDEAFTYTILSRAHQSDIYYGNIVSFDVAMKRFSNEPTKMAEFLTEQYLAYFKRHFESVKGSVIALENPDKKYSWTLKIAFDITHNGGRTQLSEIIGFRDSKIQRVMDALE